MWKRMYGRIYMNWKHFYIEAGLAVLLMIALGIAGAKGVLSFQTSESDMDKKLISGNKKEEDILTKEETELQETQALISSGQYPVMGSSDITVQDMVDYFNDSGEEYPSEDLSEGGAESIEAFCQMYIDEAAAEGVRPEVAFAQTMKETGFLCSY